ncbi:hypothetical protein QYF61_015210 [Mycteria americana]|uniref:Uncharacterized protein n=1 Tax=Mycteria americana TaxID=33587 RepID=A0AAN7MQ31_MYCAM|nr:hypothetical protein QYF61_015210 [Mycteria americana]
MASNHHIARKSFSVREQEVQRGTFPWLLSNQFIPWSVLILGIALTQVQDLALRIVEVHEVCMGPLLKPVKVALDGIPSLLRINCTTELGVICKLAEGALNPTIYITDEDTK